MWRQFSKVNELFLRLVWISANNHQTNPNISWNWQMEKEYRNVLPILRIFILCSSFILSSLKIHNTCASVFYYVYIVQWPERILYVQPMHTNKHINARNSECFRKKEQQRRLKSNKHTLSALSKCHWTKIHKNTQKFSRTRAERCSASQSMYVCIFGRRRRKNWFRPQCNECTSLTHCRLKYIHHPYSKDHSYILCSRLY